jgi:hypothetical protein
MLRFLIVSLVACGTSSLPAGAQCQQASECDTGLDCLELAQFNGTTCTVVGKACTTTCLDDSGCAALGSDFRCFQGCGTTKTCGKTL